MVHASHPYKTVGNTTVSRTLSFVFLHCPFQIEIILEKKYGLNITNVHSYYNYLKTIRSMALQSDLDYLHFINYINYNF